MSLHELSHEQREIRDLARRFADEKVAPHAGRWDRDHHFPREVFEEPLIENELAADRCIALVSVEAFLGAGLQQR